MNSPTSPPEKLRAAALLIAEAIDALDPSLPTENTARRTLGNTRGKLLRWADTLYRVGNGAEQRFLAHIHSCHDCQNNPMALCPTGASLQRGNQ